MKDYVTMKEAALLIGKTSKTVKNYIKKGLIKNFFLVEGKYGQEYKISVRDLEPLGIVYPSVLEDDFSTRGKNVASEAYYQGNNGSIPEEKADNGVDEDLLMERYEELLMELGRSRERLETMGEDNRKLRQEIEEKDMLIQMLMKKSHGSENDFSGGNH